MLKGVSMALCVGVICCFSSVARAECTKDVECKGERVCEGGQCVEPAVSPPEISPVPFARTEAGADPDPHFFDDDEPRHKPKKRIGRPGMMAAGIALAASAPIVLVTGVLTTRCDRDTTDDCNVGPRLLGFTAISLALVGLGVPLIVIGAKRVPVRQVSALPWVGPRDAGLQLRFQL